MHRRVRQGDELIEVSTNNASRVGCRTQTQSTTIRAADAVCQRRPTAAWLRAAPESYAPTSPAGLPGAVTPVRRARVSRSEHSHM